MDFEFCILFPPVIGTYRQPGPLPYDTAIYGTRMTWLPLAKRDAFQVRVRWGHGLLWINADPEDVRCN